MSDEQAMFDHDEEDDSCQSEEISVSENSDSKEDIDANKKMENLMSKLKINKTSKELWMDNIGPNRGMYF